MDDGGLSLSWQQPLAESGGQSVNGGVEVEPEEGDGDGGHDHRREEGCPEEAAAARGVAQQDGECGGDGQLDGQRGDEDDEVVEGGAPEHDVGEDAPVVVESCGDGSGTLSPVEEAHGE